MFAVIKTGGKQYKVAVNDVIRIEKLEGAAGDQLVFDSVLMVNNEIGAPFIAGASVVGTIVDQVRSKKTISFHKRRRKNSKRKRGHRQHLTMVEIHEILTGGAKSTGAKPAAKAAPAPKAAAKVEPSAAEVSAAAAAGAAAAVAAAKAAGLDTAKFQRLSAAVGTKDDIELISGIGPTIGKKLNALGIWHFWQVVAMDQADIDGIEAEVGFKGRAQRDEWREQAKELMDGKGPRAKVDQERAAAKA